MYSGEDRMSVSLTTVEIVSDGDGARLTYTEQGAFLDGIDTPEARQGGTEWMLDNLGKYLALEMP
jgi:endonuclease YncB( thermonuclease family)